MPAAESMLASVAQMMQNEHARAHLLPAIKGSDMPTRWNALRAYYKAALPEILEAGRNEWGVDPYEVDWLHVFSPIERDLWHDIRACNAVLYPQFPVAGYFVDFGNPVAKVCIECDGAAFHQDKSKDNARTTRIEEAGWLVYRITGRDCKSDFNDDTMQQGAARIFVERIANDARIRRGEAVYQS